MRAFINKILSSGYLRIGAGLLVGLLIFYLLVREMNFGDVWRVLQKSQAQFVWLALGSVVVNVWAKTARWQVLLGPTQKSVSRGKILMALMTGQTLNWFLPGRVGDLTRVYSIGSLGPGKTFVLGTVALEKLLDMISYLLLLVGLVVLLPMPIWISASGYSLAYLTAGVSLGVILVSRYPRRFLELAQRLSGCLPDSLQNKITVRLKAALTSLWVFNEGGELLKLAGLSAVVWGTAIGTNYLTFLALGLQLPWTAALAVLVALQAGISAPGVPGRIGLFQYLCVLALGIFGTDQVTSLGYGVLLQAIILVPTTLVSLVFMGNSGILTRRVRLGDIAEAPDEAMIH
jgi:uncharacterized protein (TIRG00374 family)